MSRSRIMVQFSNISAPYKLVFEQIEYRNFVSFGSSGLHPWCFSCLSSAVHANARAFQPHEVSHLSGPALMNTNGPAY
jgi:hypothetical protein